MGGSGWCEGASLSLDERSGRPSTAGRATASSRRALSMEDAGHFYAMAAAAPPRPPSSATIAAATPRASANLARQRALETQRSDIFGHGVEGRRHWSVGPNLAARPWERPLSSAR